MLIPFDQLSDDALQGLAEDYLTSGADQYMGNLSREIPKVINQLSGGHLVVEFSEIDESIALKRKEDLFQ